MIKKSLKFISIASVAIGMSLTMFSPSALAATENSELLSSQELGEVQAWFDSYGVNREIQASLQKTIEDGELIDSMKEGTKPIFSQKVVHGGFEETVSTFSDGSISVAGTQIPTQVSPTTIMPFASLTGCKVTNGSGYSAASGCLVKHSTGYLTMSFTAGYEIVNGANDRITSAHSPKATSSIAKVSNISLTKIRMKETGANSPAHVSMRATVSHLATSTKFIHLKVGQNSARVSDNF